MRLLAEREGYVRRAARFEKTREDVEAPKRVEEVIRKVKALARDHGADPDVVEKVYQTMISRFIAIETEEHTRDQR